MKNEEIQEIELSVSQANAQIKEAKKMVSLVEDYQKLIETPEWKNVIDEYYLKDNAVRTTHLLDQPQFRSSEAQGALNRTLAGISAFKSFCLYLPAMKEEAEQLIIQLEEAEMVGSDDE
jgi:hypothetical protein